MNTNACLCPLLLLVGLMAGVATAPPAAWGAGYLLFTTEWESFRGRVYAMDEDGNLKIAKEHQVPFEAPHINASPDGRTVILSGGAQPKINVFFIGDDGSVSDPLNL